MRDIWSPHTCVPSSRPPEPGHGAAVWRHPPLCPPHTDFPLFSISLLNACRCNMAHKSGFNPTRHSQWHNNVQISSTSSDLITFQMWSSTAVLHLQTLHITLKSLIKKQLLMQLLHLAVASTLCLAPTKFPLPLAHLGWYLICIPSTKRQRILFWIHEKKE